jgi:hypothetical protein
MEVEEQAQAGSPKASIKILPNGRVEFTDADGEVITFPNVDKYEKYCVSLGIDILKEKVSSPRGEKRPSEERDQGERESRGSKSKRQEQPKAVKEEETPAEPPRPASAPEVTVEGPAAASTDNPAQTARPKAKEDWEREPMTQEEITQMRREHRNLVARNVAEATDLHPSYKGWEDTSIERDRLANLQMGERSGRGAIASATELRQYKSTTCPPHTFHFKKCVLDILRNKKSPYDKDVVINMDAAGWVKSTDLVTVLQDELPGVRVTIGRLISLVYEDIPVHADVER